MIVTNCSWSALLILSFWKCLLVEARKKPKPGQPGFKYSGPHGDHSSESSLISDGKIWIIVTVCASVIAFGALICSPCCWKYFKKRKDQVCYLCHKLVKYRAWHDGSHRQTCSEENRQYLEKLSTPCDVYCPQCELKLRLWPVQDHAKFRCHSKDCVHHKSGHELDNDGSNRFNCFLHDYDICGDCVMKARGTV